MAPSMSLKRALAATFVLSLLMFAVSDAHESAENKNTCNVEETTPNLEVDHSAASGNPKSPLAVEFVTAHNKIRASKGVPPLKWDNKLAEYAHRYTATRLSDCKLIHSDTPYGENLYGGVGGDWTPTQAVEDWASEEKFYDPKTYECTNGEMCGHYTQVVWRKTTKVGCVSEKCKAGGNFIMCSYDPPGNWIGADPFA